MNSNEFLLIVEEHKAKNPIWFALETATIGTDAEIDKAEEQLSVILPKEYKFFVKNFGGGYFAFTNIFSVSDSEWNIVKLNSKVDQIQSHKFIAVSDNQTGDFYGFEIVDGKCNPKIKFYDHQTKQITETKFKNLYQYLLTVGLNIV